MEKGAPSCASVHADSGVLWMWVPLRLMALRMHDLNQSAKWLLALILFPGVFFALGKPSSRHCS